MEVEPDKKEDALDFEDFYDLLGVDSDADTEIIENAARELLGEYHPDVSSHPDAEELYEEINLAERILTDETQRSIYDALGHTEYIQKREKYGALQLSIESVDDLEMAKVDQDGNLVKGGAAARDHRGEASEGTPKGYNKDKDVFFMTEVDLDSPQESLQKIFYQVTTVRVLTLLGIIMLGYIIPWTEQKLFDSPGLRIGESVVVTMFAFTACILIIGFGAVVYKTGVEAEEKLLRAGITEAYQQKQSEESEGEENEFSYVTASDTNVYSTGGGGIDGLAQAWYLLLTGYLLTVGGVLAPGVHPWEHIRLFISEQSNTIPLWLEFQSEQMGDLLFILNVLFGIVILILVFAGVLTSVYTLSKHVWKDYYLESQIRHPNLWDLSLYTMFSCFIIGFLYGSDPLIRVPGDRRNVLYDYFVLSPNAVGLTISVIGVTGLIYMMYKYRKAASSEQTNE